MSNYPTTVTDIYTDASLYGWGAHTDSLESNGVWNNAERCCHINVLEMMAVRNALVSFDQIRGEIDMHLKHCHWARTIESCWK